MTEFEVDEQGRQLPPTSGAEVSTLVGYWRFLRDSIGWKCAGLSDEQLRATHPPAVMTLGGLLAHLAFVEDYWFGMVVLGREAAEPFKDVDWEADPDWEWALAETWSGEELFRLWRDLSKVSDEIVSKLVEQPGALDVVYGPERRRVSLRWILVHMIEEYGRHCGHADLIREAIDGLVGE